MLVVNSFDTAVYNFVIKAMCEPVTAIAKIITNFGGAVVLIALCLIALIFIKNKKYGVAMTVNLAVVTLINLIIKNIVCRERPNVLRLVEETGYSFPSGHSMASMAFYGFLIYLIYTSKIKSKALKITLCTAIGVLILLIGLSRIYVGVHYASDVLSGFIISFTYLILFINLVYNKYGDKIFKKNK